MTSATPANPATEAALQAHRFNVRAYGIYLNADAEVLLSSEQHHGRTINKFPGGGLEFGEGLADCLRREWKEETGLDVAIIRHYYTTDFFQPSAFRAQDQVISIYFLVRPAHGTDDQAAALPTAREGIHAFSWVPVAKLSKELMTFPIDQHVAEQLRHDFGGFALYPKL